jgi:phosphoglycolate phosphatase
MPQYSTLLFDLDGTLTDPREGITRSIQYALRKMGQEPPPCEELLCCIGPPLLASFQKYFGMSEADARQATACYREYFGERGIFENRVYPGIPELLSELKTAGRRLVLATAKPEIYAEKILRHFGLHVYFDLVAGANFNNTRIYKFEVIGKK